MKTSLKRVLSTLAFAAVLAGACKFTDDFASFSLMRSERVDFRDADAHTSGLLFFAEPDRIAAYKNGRLANWVDFNSTQVAASSLSNQVWGHYAWGSPDTLIFKRFHLRTDGSSKATATIRLTDWDWVNDFDVGPGETLYVAGRHKKKGYAVGYCKVIDDDTCANWVVQNRRSDLAFALLGPRQIKVDPKDGRVIVYDDSESSESPTPPAFLAYTSTLAPTGTPALEVAGWDFDIASGLLVTTGEGKLDLYLVGKDGSFSLMDSRDFEGVLPIGYATSDTCGHIWTAGSNTLKGGKYAFVLNRYGVCTDGK